MAAEGGMTSLQALIAGAVRGALMRAAGEGSPFLIDVEPLMDGGNYLPELIVRGRETGEVVRVRVEVEEPS